MTIAREVLTIGALRTGAVAWLPSHGDDVDAQRPWSRSQRRLEQSQAAADAVQLRLGNAAFGSWVFGTRFDLDGNPDATAPRQDVDLATRQPQVARDYAIPPSA